MTQGPADADIQDFERLASRLAMLVGDDGEAENAGRAAGALARQLGLSGGHLKAIFMAGAGRLLGAARDAGQQSARVQGLETEVEGLRHGIEQIDRAFRHAMAERDEARREADDLRDALERVSTARRVRGSVVIVLFTAILAGAAFLEFGPRLGGARPAPTPLAVVRAGEGAVVRDRADRDASAMTRLPPGTRLPVRALVWQGRDQWAEVEIGETRGFVAAADLQTE